MASESNYWTKLRAGTNSLLPLSTDESTNRLYARSAPARHSQTVAATPRRCGAEALEYF